MVSVVILFRLGLGLDWSGLAWLGSVWFGLVLIWFLARLGSFGLPLFLFGSLDFVFVVWVGLGLSPHISIAETHLAYTEPCVPA